MLVVGLVTREGFDGREELVMRATNTLFDLQRDIQSRGSELD
jgi:hypothetical protein